MNIDLKVLHLRHALRYVPMERPASIDEMALSGLALRFGECLLVFKESNLSMMTDEGPRLSSSLAPESSYRTESDERAATYSLAPGDYLFFQWRARNAAGQVAAPSFFPILEEAVREAWWQGVGCEGPWFIRLVSEDEKVAIQALRKLKKAP